MNVFEELTWRGLVADFTRVPETGENPPPQLPERLQRPITLYCGFDPTADSLHVGSLVPLITLRRFQMAGHTPIALAGGATGCIGDPSGKTQERQLLTRDQIVSNVEALRPQLECFLEFGDVPNAARLENNDHWFSSISYIDFLRDVGKYFTVNQMVAKESVRARMEDRDIGISYTEFSYMLLQAYDFYHLVQGQGCELQIGGSDQWGNITAGLELVRKRLGKSVYGLTLPLIAKSDGTKFGKTESGTIWLDAKRTSVYQFYQFWINTDDRDTVNFLKYFTFLEKDAIDALEQSLKEDPGKRAAQIALANEVTTLIHGGAATKDAVKASQILFGGSLDDLEPSTLAMLANEVPNATVSAAELSEGLGLLDALVFSGLAQSKGNARKDVQGGGVSVNGARVQDPQQRLTTADLLADKYVVLRRGKKNYAMLALS